MTYSRLPFLIPTLVCTTTILSLTLTPNRLHFFSAFLRIVSSLDLIPPSLIMMQFFNSQDNRKVVMMSLPSFKSRNSFVSGVQGKWLWMQQWHFTSRI